MAYTQFISSLVSVACKGQIHTVLGSIYHPLSPKCHIVERDSHRIQFPLKYFIQVDVVTRVNYTTESKPLNAIYHMKKS